MLLFQAAPVRAAVKQSDTDAFNSSVDRELSLLDGEIEQRLGPGNAQSEVEESAPGSDNADSTSKAAAAPDVPVYDKQASPAPAYVPPPAPVVKSAPAPPVQTQPVKAQSNDQVAGAALPVDNGGQDDAGIAPTSAASAAHPDTVGPEIDKLEKKLDERIKVKGKYRFAFGAGRHRTPSFNDSDSDLADRDFHYLFGERLNNTFDPAIYSMYEANIDAQVTDRISTHARIVADPWALTATTPESIVAAPGGDSFNVRLKYFGSNNSTVGEIYRAHFRNISAFPITEAVDGKVPAFTVTGVSDLGLSYNSPALDLDYNYEPVRQLWVDYETEKSHWRVFALAQQDQAMTTDDPLGLSNTKDFWQPSPWTARWVPIKRFADFGIPDVDGSIARGHYSDVEAFNAKTSYVEYLTALRGVSMEHDLGRAYFGGMIAAPLSPWDSYDEINNIPGVFRLKHQVTPQWMVGGLYGFRIGVIDNEPDAYNNVVSMDTNYYINPDVKLYGQAAGSRDEIDRLSQGNRRSPDGFASDVEGMAYKGGVKADFDHKGQGGGHSTFTAEMTWMDSDFRPQLSNYRAMKDDNFWGRHTTFHEYSPDLEYFRLGTGIDIGRYVGHVKLDTTIADERLHNLYDVRHVRSSDKSSFIENVMRDEVTYKITPTVKAKGFSRWALMPKTVSDVEPLLADFAFIDSYNLPPPVLQNDMIDAGLDPSRFSLGGGLQVEPAPDWVLEASYERTNDIPDFPRGLQNGVFLGAPIQDSKTPNVLLDQLQPFLYRQDIYGLPPYDYFSIIKERVVYKATKDLELTFHAAQNSYKMWGPIDEMVNHQGVSLDYRFNKDVSLFMDYTHSYLPDIPRLINTNFTELNFKDHHNVFANIRWQIDPSKRLNLTYGVFGEIFNEGENENGFGARPLNPFSVSEFSLPTVDTEQLIRISLEGDF